MTKYMTVTGEPITDGDTVITRHGGRYVISTDSDKTYPVNLLDRYSQEYVTSCTYDGYRYKNAGISDLDIMSVVYKDLNLKVGDQVVLRCGDVVTIFEVDTACSSLVYRYNYQGRVYGVYGNGYYDSTGKHRLDIVCKREPQSVKVCYDFTKYYRVWYENISEHSKYKGTLYSHMYPTIEGARRFAESVKRDGYKLLAITPAKESNGFTELTIGEGLEDLDD